MNRTCVRAKSASPRSLRSPALWGSTRPPSPAISDGDAGRSMVIGQRTISGSGCGRVTRIAVRPASRRLTSHRPRRTICGDGSSANRVAGRCPGAVGGGRLPPVADSDAHAGWLHHPRHPCAADALGVVEAAGAGARLPAAHRHPPDPLRWFLLPLALQPRRAAAELCGAGRLGRHHRCHPRDCAADRRLVVEPLARRAASSGT